MWSELTFLNWDLTTVSDRLSCMWACEAGIHLYPNSSITRKKQVLKNVVMGFIKVSPNILQSVPKKSLSTLKPYGVRNFWSRNVLKRNIKQNFSENVKTINWLILLEEFMEKMQQAYVKCRHQKYCSMSASSETTVSCEWLEKCSTGTIESCFSSDRVIQHVLLRPE